VHADARPLGLAVLAAAGIGGLTMLNLGTLAQAGLAGLALAGVGLAAEPRLGEAIWLVPGSLAAALLAVGALHLLGPALALVGLDAAAFRHPAVAATAIAGLIGAGLHRRRAAEDEPPSGSGEV